ncbi:MAG: LysM peptidoglycan-binding domain-containing protein [Anaerolineae bacterium]
MLKKLGSRTLIVALVVAFVLALGLASVSLAAPADSPNNWWCTGYIVHPGDTLSSISWMYGVPVHALAAFNGIKNPNFIRIGQCINIPPAGGHYWKPYPGQNWCNSCGWGGSWGYDKGSWCGTGCGSCNSGCNSQPKPMPKPIQPLPHPVPHR